MSRPPRRPVAGAVATTVLCLLIAACSPAAVPSASPASSATPTQSTTTASPVASSAPSTPSATPAGTSAIVACTPADIVATAGPLGGAAGSRGADIAVGASGAASCQLPTSPVVALADPSGKVLLNSHLPVGADGPVLSAGASFSFSFQLSNWCDQSAAMPLDVLLALGSGSVKVAGLSLASADLPPCNGPGQPAVLSTTDWLQR
jgi:hypothetical protein